MKNIYKIIYAVFLMGVFFTPALLSAQEVHNSYQGTFHGEVLEIISDTMREIPGTDTYHLFQTIRAEVLDGSKKGEIIIIENDYLQLEEGDRFYFKHSIFIDGTELYGIINIDRKGSLMMLGLFFVFIVVLFGGWKGARSLLSLAGSLLAIFFILLPGLIHGWNPLVASILVASGILFVAIFVTHGFNRESLVAYSGTMLAVLFTGVLAIIAVHTNDLSGFAEEAAVALNFTTRGALDLTALLIGAIIIGVLGVLDDIAVTQAAVVTELYNSNPEITRREVYMRAMRVGRSHTGSLMNTLVLAYTGAALPILLLTYMSPSGIGATINSEVFATEIVRTIVGSIGLIVTVPIVTLLAVFFLKGYKPKHERHVHLH